MSENLKDLISEIIDDLNQDLYEREEAVVMSLLGALSGQNVFMLGLPGVGKSLMARRIAKIFDGKYFEYLMNKFSAPEDLFGPVSISALKEDQFSRKTNGFLPDANFAFLDEIWKSSAAILNSLLTIANERKFKNGVENIDVPLSYIISASNETPPENQGLDALYDRFPIRLYVSPIYKNESRKSYLSNIANMNFKPKHIIDIEELKNHRSEIEKISVGKNTLQAFMQIIDDCHNSKEPIYVSDRRQKQILNILKCSAYYNNQKFVDVKELILLNHFLWEKQDDIEKVENIIKENIIAYLIPDGFDIHAYKETLDELDEEIIENMFHNKDEITGYETNYEENGEDYYKITIKNDTYYIDFDNNYKCYEYNRSYGRLDVIGTATLDPKTHILTLPDNIGTVQLKPTYKHKKGAPKEGLDYNTINTNVNKVNSCIKKIDEGINIYNKYSENIKNNKGHFIVSSSSEKLDEIIDKNKETLESMKITSLKLEEKIKKITVATKTE